MKQQSIATDVVVVGGGLAGVAAAIAAARLGRRVALVNNRPVLGGNSSSEVRVWVCGATAHGNQRWARENGIVGELYVENQYRNPEGNPVYWDDVVLDAVRAEPNITLLLNTDVREVEATGPQDARRIVSVTGWTMGSEILTTFTAPVFIDCTGDGLVGLLAGARYRLGKEARHEFNEDWAPEVAKREFLGSTLLFYTRDVGRPVKFVPPDSTIDIGQTPIPRSRIIRSGDSGAAYWWIEWGGELDIVDDNERIRDELRGVVLGIWDHIKNSGEFDADNLTLEWIGNLPGKREYRRFVGDYTLHQNDVLEQTAFHDGVAFGGWSIDLHPVEGMYSQGAGALQRFSDGVFEIPYRSLYSVNVENMFMAGRDFSATHVAFGAARVMATCGAMGEAAGTAAALCLDLGVTPRGLGLEHTPLLRRTLLRQDAPVLGVANDDPDDLAREASVTASSSTTHLGVEVDDAGVPVGDLTPFSLETDLGIALPVDPRLDEIGLWVQTRRATTLGVEVFSTGRTQNVVPAVLETKTDVDLEPTEGPRWVAAPVDYAPDGPGNAVVVLRANADVTVWTTTPLPPGVLTLVHREDSEDANVDIPPGQALLAWPTKPLRGRTIAFRATPETRALLPERATSGYNRPFGGPHTWVSRPMTDAPEWLRLDWETPVTAREVRVVLDDDVDLELNTLHHHRSPHEIIPELVGSYRIEVLPAGAASEGGDDAWRVVADVTDNRRRQRVHPLPATPVSALRLVVRGTQGAAQARVVALRVQR